MSSMRLRRLDDSVAKTASFAVIHLAIAVALGWLFTGGFILGGLLAFVEPAVNTVSAHQLEKLIGRLDMAPRRRAWVLSGSLTASHLVVAVGVGFALTGSWVVAGAYAVVEPLANAVAHHFFTRWWDGRRRAAPQLALAA
jgi:uncharacterized membrane protein